MGKSKTRLEKLETGKPEPEDSELVDCTWMLDAIHAAYGSPPETERHYITRAAYDEIFRKLNAVYGPGSPFYEQKYGSKPAPMRFTDQEEQEPQEQKPERLGKPSKIYPPGYKGE